MMTIEYIEDALAEIIKLALWNDDLLEWKDHTILSSLDNAVQKEGALTVRQGNLLLKILAKYQHLTQFGFDLSIVIAQPKWKRDFRKLDLTKSADIQVDQDGTMWIVMKFPYSLVKEFETEIISEQGIKWCPESRVRKLKFYDFNIVAINEFVKKHGFIVTDAFLDALLQVEDMWEHQDNIIPHGAIDNGEVTLLNAAPDAISYFLENKTGVIEKDMFLAKTMGFPVKLTRPPTTVVERISEDLNSHFWMRSNKEFLQLYNTIDGVAAIILDRNIENMIGWLNQFIHDATDMGIDTSKFRVCHREPKDSKTPINEWIKANHLGGKIDKGQLFIFKHKPAKWLFSNDVDVKIVGTNSYIPVSETSALWWMQSHPCVCYISDIKPTKTRNRAIAHL